MTGRKNKISEKIHLKILTLSAVVGIILMCCSPKQSSEDPSHKQLEITDEKIDHLGITNREYLSAASKRALA